MFLSFFTFSKAKYVIKIQNVEKFYTLMGIVSIIVSIIIDLSAFLKYNDTTDIRWVWIKLGKKEKIIKKLLSRPKDFSFNEVTALLNSYGYVERKGGKTGGSRVAFANENNDYIRIHKPHQRNSLLPYQVSNLINDLTERGLL